MIRNIIHITILSSISLFTYSQSNINKLEIYSKWKSIQNEYNDVVRKHNLDSLVVKTVDNLRDLGIDSIGIYSKYYDDSYVDDKYSYECQPIQWIAFVQWVNNGQTFHQKILKCHVFEPVLIDSSVMIKYYENYWASINKEGIIPIISGASIDKGEIILDFVGIEPHTIEYSIYCDLNGKSKFSRFYQCEFDSKENLFYIENQNSIINSWKKMIDNQIAEIEK